MIAILSHALHHAEEPARAIAEWLEQAGFQEVETSIVERETKAPKLQKLVATAKKA